jgi:hypothetical protein
MYVLMFGFFLRDFAACKISLMTLTALPATKQIGRFQRHSPKAPKLAEPCAVRVSTTLIQALFNFVQPHSNNRIRFFTR